MDDLSCQHRWANKGSVPWHPRESRSPCKNAVNDSTIASSISWWQGWHLFHCNSPMSLQDGKKIFTDKQQLATGFACSSRTVSPDEHCYRLICASCTQFHVPLGMQAFQLPQAASKQRSVPWCCRCGMFAAFSTAAIRLLRSIFIWAPPRTRPKFQHLCEHRKIFQPVSRMLILEIHNAVVAVPADVTSLGCHCPPNIFYAPDCFLIYFIWWWRKCGIVTVMTFAQPAETCWDVQLSSDSFGSPGSWLAPQQIQMVVSAFFQWHIFFKTTGQPAFTR